MKVRMEINKCVWEWESFNSDFHDKNVQENLVMALAEQFLELFESRVVGEASNNDPISED